jgi:hypothetical protein
VELQPDVADTHILRFSTTGQYSTKSAYEALFIGSIHFSPWEWISKSWPPGKCKFFMWTVAHKKCWIADSLARKGLPHLVVCPLCDQSDETIDHLLVSCIFSRQVWFTILQGFGLQDLASQSVELSFEDWFAILQGFGLQDLASQSVELSFEDWWDNISKRVSGQGKKGLNSIVILKAWACGTIGTAVFLTGPVLGYPKLMQSSMMSCCSGPLLGVDEFHSSLPKTAAT